jgi:CBS-domain-containing membrane protein
MDWVATLARLQPWYLLVRFPRKSTRAVFAFLGGAMAIGIIGAIAGVTGQPLVFPSLGPTAFLFFSQPAAPASCPRNAILSHGSGILIGWATYWLFHVTFRGETVVTEVGAASLSLGLMSAWMVIAKIAHPPAASTTLIVALGLMVQWQELLAVMAAIVLLTVQCYLINRLSGIASPVWAPLPQCRSDQLELAALCTENAAATKNSYTEIADLIVSRQKLPKSSPYVSKNCLAWGTNRNHSGQTETSSKARLLRSGEMYPCW